MSGPPLVLEVPDLTTGTVRLRPWRLDDAPSLARAWRDPAIIAGSTPPPDGSVDAAARWIAGCDERRLAGLALDLVVAAVADDRVLGEVGLHRLDAERRAAAMGWWVHEEARGAGVATAAVTLFADWLLASTPLDHLVAEIEVDNAASEAVAGAAGLVPAAPGVWHRSVRPTP